MQFGVKSFFTAPQTRLKWWEVFFLLTIAAAMLWIGLMTAQRQRLQGELIRLHVVANSDTQADQSLKLKVRDAVLEEVSQYAAGAESAEEAAGLLREHLRDLEQVGAQVAAREGYSYPVQASLEQVHFPTKYYDGFALPAGEYRALRIVLGEGKGHNWWCVVFPSLCVVPASEWKEVAVSGGMNPADVALMGEEGEYELRFKLFEWLDRWQQRRK